MSLKDVAWTAATSEAIVPLWRPLVSDLAILLTLHRFSDPARGVVGHSADELRENLAFLQRHRFNLGSLADAVAGVPPQHPDRPTVFFTVDDGYVDFATTAAPVFAEFDCPVTVFMVTGPIDTRSWLWWDRVEFIINSTRRFGLELQLGRRTATWTWSSPQERYAAVLSVTHAIKLISDDDRERALTSLAKWLEVELPPTPTERYATMAWSDVRRCASAGVSFAPHTVTHPMLPNVRTAERVEFEMIESYRRLKAECATTVPIISYPNGAFSQREVGILAKSDLRAAVTTRQQYASLHAFTAQSAETRFGLPRFSYVGDRPQFIRVVTGLERLVMRIREGREHWAPIGADARPAATSNGA